MAEKLTPEEIAKRLTAQKESVELAEKELKIIQEQKKLYKEITSFRTDGNIELMEYEERILNAKKAALEAEEKAKTIKAQITNEMKQQLDGLKENSKAYRDLTAQIQDLEKASLDDAEDLLIAIGRQNEELAIQLKLRRKNRDEQKKEEDSQKKYEKHLTDARGKMDNLAKASGLFSVNLTGVTRSIGEMVDGTTEQGRAMREAFFERFNLTNLFASLAMAIVEATASLVKAADVAVTKFAAMTGAGSKFNDVIISTQRNLNLLGVTMEEAADATAALLLNTSRFVLLAPGLRNTLVQQASLLSKLGLSGEDYARSFDTLNLGLHMTGQQAQETASQLAIAGADIGIDASTMARNFENAMSSLAIYGPRAKNMFIDLQAAAKASGVSIDTLLGIAKQFDTFEGAAKQVQTFNALLGTQLSTTKMVMMTEEDRIKTLIKNLNSQGRAFKDLDRFVRKSIAAELNISELEAEKIFGMDVRGYEMYRRKMEDTADAQERIKKAVNDALPLTEQFVILFKELGTEVLPILRFLRKTLTFIRESIEAADESTAKFAKRLVLLGGAVAGIAASVYPAYKALAALKGIMAGAGAVSLTAAGGGLIASMVVGAKAIGLFLLGVLALTAALGIMMVMWEGFSAAARWFGSMGQGMSDVAQAAEDMARLESQTTPKASAVLENLALLKTGNAAQALTGEHIAATVNNIHSSVEAILPSQMTLVIDAASRTTLNAYIDSRARGIAAGTITSPIQMRN